MSRARSSLVKVLLDLLQRMRRRSSRSVGFTCFIMFPTTKPLTHSLIVPRYTTIRPVDCASGCRRTRADRGGSGCKHLPRRRASLPKLLMSFDLMRSSACEKILLSREKTSTRLLRASFPLRGRFEYSSRPFPFSRLPLRAGCVAGLLRYGHRFLYILMSGRCGSDMRCSTCHRKYPRCRRIRQQDSPLRHTDSLRRRARMCQAKS